MEIAAYTIIFLLALYGLRELLMAAARLMLMPRTKIKSCTVIELRDHMEDIEYILRSALFSQRGQVIAADCGADEETLEIALRLSLQNNRLRVVRSDDLE